MNDCVKGMTKEQIFMELAQDDLGKCSGCEKLTYKNGMMTCDCLQSSGGGK